MFHLCTFLEIHIQKYKQILSGNLISFQRAILFLRSCFYTFVFAINQHNIFLYFDRKTQTNMITLLIVFSLSSNVLATNRNVRSSSHNLQTAFQALINNDQVIVAIPKDERRVNVSNHPEIYNQPCNQETFYENLVHNSLVNKPLQHPTFLIKPFYQNPRSRCFASYK